MAKKKAPTRTFVVLSRAWYGPAVLERSDYVEDVLIRFKGGDGDWRELAIRWYDFPGSPRVGVCVEVFEDAWSAFEEIPEFFKLLSELEDEEFTADELAAWLEEGAFVDVTPSGRE